MRLLKRLFQRLLVASTKSLATTPNLPDYPLGNQLAQQPQEANM